METRTLPKLSSRKVFLVSLIALLLLVVIYLWLNFYRNLATSWYTITDWVILRQGIRVILAGKNPYATVSTFFNPPWIALPLLPLALLPEGVGGQINSLIGLFVFGYAAYRLKAKPVATVALLLSPPVLTSVLYSNIEWMIALGLVLPPQIGLFFVMAKPQLGIGAAIFWAVEAYRTGGVRKVLVTFAPVVLAFLVSFLIYGLYPLKSGMLYAIHWNASLFPGSIPIGLFILYLALRKRRLGWASAASPFLSPYLTFYGYSISILGVIPDTLAVVLLSVGYWLYFIVRLFQH